MLFSSSTVLSHISNLLRYCEFHLADLIFCNGLPWLSASSTNKPALFIVAFIVAVAHT